MIDMSHDTDDRRSLRHVLDVFLILFEQFGDHIDLYFLLADDLIFNRDLLCLFVADLLIDRHDLALQKELLHDRRGLQLHLIRKFSDREGIRKRDHFDLLFLLLLFLFGSDKSPCPFSF